MAAFVLVVLILLLISIIPAWPYSRHWGYYPLVGIGLLFVILSGLVLFRVV